MPVRPAHVDRPDRQHDILTACLLRAAEGDQQAFAEVYDAVERRVYGVTLRVLGDPHQAEEVAQEALVEVWRTSARFDPSRGSAGAWITTIAHHRAVDRVRSSAATRRRDTSWHEETSGVPGPDSTFDSATAHLAARSIHSALAQLSPVQRRAIELAYFGGYTYADVARLMHTPLGTTKTRIRTALLRLRDTMDPAHADLA